MECVIKGTTVKFIVGDITESDTEAIVNAANSSLMGGGGVDGAIHSKGGPAILQECKEIRKTLYPEGLPTGNAVITTAGKLKAKYVIHTVGPICNGKMTDEEKNLLYSAYKNSLKLAKEVGVKSISFPSISTGAYRCNIEEASEVAVKSVIDFIDEEQHFEIIQFVLFTPEIYNIYTKTFKNLVTECR